MVNSTSRPCVGLVTYHSALNFGSVLQALATQNVLDALVGPTTIIDYRPTEQSRFYSLYRTHMGVKSFLADCSLIPEQRARRQRKIRFEAFINNNLHLTQDMSQEPEEVFKYSDSFDIFISGSDQILNKHSNELERSPWSAMDPYLLTFTKRYKASYASSPANMTDSEYLRLKKPLLSFSKISSRERESSEKLEKMLGREVPTVLDPTLLLNAGEWNKYSNDSYLKKTDESYLLYYSLDGPRQGLPKLKAVQKIAESVGLKLRALTPYTYVRNNDKRVSCADAGPAEFLALISSASCVITDSYHGTLFSVNYQKPFWSISTGKGSSTRKDQALSNLGLSNRIVRDFGDFEHLDVLQEPDTATANSLLGNLRDYSYRYISSISEEYLRSSIQ